MWYILCNPFITCAATKRLFYTGAKREREGERERERERDYIYLRIYVISIVRLVFDSPAGARMRCFGF